MYMKKTQTQSLYIVFGIVIAGLVVLIGWFIYLLVKPATPVSTTKTAVITNTTNTTVTTNSKTKKTNTNTTVKNSNTTVNSNANSNSNTNAGLIEPQPPTTNTNTTNTNSTSTNTTTNTNTTTAVTETAPVDNGDGTTAITLYFPKTGGVCGAVSPVRRTITTPTDLFGQIVIEDMHGPSSDDTGYDSAMTSAMPSGLHLRYVQYDHDTGSTVTVNEAYDTLSDCDRKTADAELITTANAMFEVDLATSGQVVVGEVPTDTNSNTNQ